MHEIVIWSVLLSPSTPLFVLAVRSQMAVRENRRRQARTAARLAAARPRLVLVKPS